MNTKTQHIWIWLQDNMLHKAVYNTKDNTLTVYNEQDEIILRRTGITAEQLNKLEALFIKLGAKRLDGHKEPFTYL